MKKIDKYINLILTMGINLQPYQRLLIWCPVEASGFARLVMQRAYQLGAFEVEVCYEDKSFTNLSYSLANSEKPENFNEFCYSIKREESYKYSVILKSVKNLTKVLRPLR